MREIHALHVAVRTRERERDEAKADARLQRNVHSTADIHVNQILGYLQH